MKGRDRLAATEAVLKPDGMPPKGANTMPASRDHLRLTSLWQAAMEISVNGPAQNTAAPIASPTRDTLASCHDRMSHLSEVDVGTADRHT